MKVSSNDHPSSPRPQQTGELSVIEATAPGRRRAVRGPCLVGVLEGEGIGPEVIRASLRVLSAIESANSVKFEVQTGGLIGLESASRCGKTLAEETVDFCNAVFDRGGAILSGPGGGRFVYELRHRFNLYCKVVPLKPCPELMRASRFRAKHLRGVDILIARDNIAGVYQGQWRELASSAEGRIAEHTFSYTESQVRRLLEAAARLARRRRGELSVVVKDGGVPTVSRLWRDVAEEVATSFSLDIAFLDVDHAAYRLLQHARDFDVVVTPNLFGDILADAGAVLLGSRGLSYSGNFSAEGSAVYQTNHGAARDLAGADRANPVAQIYALAMMLRESFGLVNEAALVEKAVASVLQQRWRTDDLAERGCRLAGTQELAERVAQAVIELSPTEMTT